MPNMKNRSRLVTMLAVTALGIAMMSPAMAAKPDETPPAQAAAAAADARVDGEAVGAENAAIGQEKAAAGQAIAAEHQLFANEKVQAVQAVIATFLAEVDRFSSCMSETAELSDGATAYDECGPLGVENSPGHFVSNGFASALTIE